MYAAQVADVKVLFEPDGLELQALVTGNSFSLSLHIVFVCIVRVIAMAKFDKLGDLRRPCFKEFN